MKFKLVETIDLYEDILTEEQEWYKITPDNTTIEPFYLNITKNEDSTPKEQILQKLNQICKNKKFEHERINSSLLAKLIEDDNYMYIDIDKVDIENEKIPISQLLIQTQRSWRNKAHKSVKADAQKIKKIKTEGKYLVHHIDADERNNDHNNLIVVPINSSDKQYSNFIHYCLHKLQPVVGKRQSSKSYPIYFYDENNQLKKYYLQILIKKTPD